MRLMILSNQINTGAASSVGVPTQNNQNIPKKVILVSNAVSPEKH
jgi:hypothetical protein